MTSTTVLALALGIGIVAGLRSLTAPAVTAWAAHLGRLDLHDSPLWFMGTAAAVAVFSLGAIVELVADKLPKTPARTAAVPLTARILMGGLSGACVCAAARVSSGMGIGVVLVSQSWVGGALTGAIGGVLGAFSGYVARTRLVRALGVKDVFVAVPEDILAIGLAILITFAR